MCRFSIAVDQSVHTISPIYDLIESSSFYVRSIRVAPVGWTRKADVYLSLGGGSKSDLERLVQKMGDLPAVLRINHILPSIWKSGDEARTANES